MERLYEKIRVEPLIHCFDTVATVSARKVRWPAENHMTVVCGLGGSSAGTAISCTAVNVAQFALYESTASSHAGSAITGATLAIGAATAYKPRSANWMSLTMTSNVTTAMKLHINGFEYYCTVSGVGSSGENVAGQIASAINGKGTFTKLPHYSAVANWGSSGIVLIQSDDGMGTGLTLATAGATDFKPYAVFTGAIDLKPGMLSTNTPKFIGISLTTCAGATAMRWADAVTMPSGRPAFGGKTVAV
jgi:hypothetical protein